MNILKNRLFLKPLILRAHSSIAVDIANNAPPLYPDLYDPSREGMRARQRKYTYDRIKSLSSVDRKLYEVSKFKQRPFKLNKFIHSYHALEFNLYCTNTHLIDGLPKSVEIENNREDLEVLKSVFFESMISELNKKLYNYGPIVNEEINRNPEFTIQKALYKMLSFVVPYLGNKYEHILNSKILWAPRNSAYWCHKDFLRTFSKSKNAFFQFDDEPIVQLRTTSPLVAEEVPKEQYPARSPIPEYLVKPSPYAMGTEKRHLTTCPGMWPSDVFPEHPARHDCALLSIQSTNFLKKQMRKFFEFDEQRFLDAAAVITSFAWASSLATHHGFTIYHDVTYPFVVPSVFTNGHTWHFYLYQMNTMSFHEDVFNPKCANLCWKSGPLELVKKEEDGSTSFNEAIPRTLLAFLTRGLMDSSQVFLRPYLGHDDRDPETRLEDYKRWRQIYANRLYKEQDRWEVPLWKRIYKNRFNKLHPRNDWIKEF